MSLIPFLTFIADNFSDAYRRHHIFERPAASFFIHHHIGKDDRVKAHGASYNPYNFFKHELLIFFYTFDINLIIIEIYRQIN
jgi:hypothetical protein